MKKYYLLFFVLVFSVFSYLYHLRRELLSHEGGTLKTKIQLNRNLEFHVLSEDKKIFNLSFLDQGKFEYVLFHFWASWCAPCEQELRDIAESADRFISLQKLQIVLVAVNDDPKKSLDVLRKYKIKEAENILILTDNKDIHLNSFGGYKLPESFLFNLRTGALIRKYEGPQPWSDRAFFDSFAVLLRSP